MTRARTPTMADVIRTAIEDRLVDVHTNLPGRIEKYDPAKQTADVKPLIRRLQRADDGEINESLPVITSVPVRFPRAGGYKITFPVKQGDFCRLVFCEASIDNYMEGNGREVDPETFYRFDLTDAVCELGWYPNSAALSSTDGDDLVMGKESGAVIHIGPDQINLYEKSAADFVALAGDVLSELQTLKGAVVQVLNYATTLAAVFATGTPIPNDGGAALKAAWAGYAAAIPTPTIPDPQSVAATKVRAT